MRRKGDKTSHRDRPQRILNIILLRSFLKRQQSRSKANAEITDFNPLGTGPNKMPELVHCDNQRKYQQGSQIVRDSSQGPCAGGSDGDGGGDGLGVDGRKGEAGGAGGEGGYSRACRGGGGGGTTRDVRGRKAAGGGRGGGDERRGRAGQADRHGGNGQDVAVAPHNDERRLGCGRVVWNGKKFGQFLIERIVSGPPARLDTRHSIV